jgi:hypothetical protein
MQSNILVVRKNWLSRWRKAPTVYAWGAMVPEGKAARLSLMTDGELVYDPKAYQLSAKSA